MTGTKNGVTFDKKHSSSFLDKLKLIAKCIYTLIETYNW